ncbi:MAG: hypothetical protein IJY13_03735, partial [Clostridia bacterium]|nr:hypothetical protein [Clostridia bacterium]
MKKLLVFVLIATLCLLPMVFSACSVDTSVLSAEEMLPHCDDNITTDPLQTMLNIDISADLYAVAFYNVPGNKVTIDFTHHDKCSVTKRIENNT